MPTSKDEFYGVKICRPILGTFFLCPLMQNALKLQYEIKKGADWQKKTKKKLSYPRKNVSSMAEYHYGFLNSKILNIIEFGTKIIVWIGSFF